MTSATRVTPYWLRRGAAWAPVFTLGAASAFVISPPAVGDLWAARARASAAEHGVGLRYWFAWFSGTVPGHYSVLAPYLTRIAGVGLLGALATVAITPLAHQLVRGGTYSTIATWLAAIASAFSLWSGRVPFAVGTALMLVALLAVRSDRRAIATVAGAVTALASPVSGAFLILGLSGMFLHDPRRRAATTGAALASGTCLIAVAAYFGLPGPEGFQPLQAVSATAAIAVMLLARPRVYVRTVLIISLVACPMLAVIPNGMGGNFERFAWICLPVATAATAEARRSVTVLVAGAALGLGVIGSAHDLFVAAQPMSSSSYYTGLIAELDHTPGLANFRLEVVPDGTHVAAYAMLGHASLARGYETQSDNAQNSVLTSPSLNPTTYKIWLDNNAVGYVALDHRTLLHSSEDTLVRSTPPAYLHRVWSDRHWLLYRVSGPSPIVARPARVVDADQADIAILTPQPGRYALRLRWSRFLRVAATGGPPANVAPDGRGWTTLTVPRAGQYIVTG